MADADFLAARRRMVEEQLRARGLRNPRLLQAFLDTPRHLFVPPAYRDRAYGDHPLPIGQGQTISQPYIVALMTDWLGLGGEEKVLEIGTGSGYQAAILARLAAEVHTVERLPALQRAAARNLDASGVGGVHLHLGDGSLGWPAAAPYDAILVAAAAPAIPAALRHQLKPGGRLVLPVGARGGQHLLLLERLPSGWRERRRLPVAFVPLIGQEGWPERERK